MNSFPSLHVFVSGFGSPHLPEKIRILQNNISNINKYPWGKIKYTVCCYDDSDLSMVENISIIRDPLIVGQYIQKYLVPNTESDDYDYVLCILDDIELQSNVDWERMIHYLNYFHIDIISPSMTYDSKFQFKYMLHEPAYSRPVLKITSALEYFCYFMSYKSYKKYYPHVNGDKNPWMWGLDMLLNKCIGLRVAITNHMQMKHWYKNESYMIRVDADPCDGYNYVLDKYNETTANLANQPSVLYMIYDVSSMV